MISICDNCENLECKFRKQNPFYCESLNKNTRKINNDRFRYETEKNCTTNYNYNQKFQIGTFELESILTHEQFNDKKYVVGE